MSWTRNIYLTVATVKSLLIDMATWWDLKNEVVETFKVENYKSFPVYIQASGGNVTGKYSSAKLKKPHETKTQTKPQQLNLLWGYIIFKFQSTGLKKQKSVPFPSWASSSFSAVLFFLYLIVHTPKCKIEGQMYYLGSFPNSLTPWHQWLQDSHCQHWILCPAKTHLLEGKD